MTTAEAATLDWIEQFVVGLNLCPFARNPLRQHRVVIREVDYTTVERTFYWTADQVQQLLATDWKVQETVLLVLLHPALRHFGDFLDFVEETEDLLRASGADAYVQLAHFHPAYCFADAPADDPANATNRSPYPTLQLLRVERVARAVAAHPDPEGIPARNAALLRDRR
jgi:hypothetical protein